MVIKGRHTQPHFEEALTLPGFTLALYHPMDSKAPRLV